MADSDVEFEEEYEYEEVYEEVEEEVIGDDDVCQDNDGFDDDDGGGGGWGDDHDMDVDVDGDQQFLIPLTKQNSSALSDDEDEEYELDHHGNIISPRADVLKNQKSVNEQCWTCSNCKSINKLTWTLSKFAMKCCICKQPTYSIQAKIFDSATWDEPSNDCWECPRCTLQNAIGSNECGACGHALQGGDDSNNAHECAYLNLEFQAAASDPSDDEASGATQSAQARTGMHGMNMSHGVHGMRMGGMGMGGGAGAGGGGDFLNNLLGSMGGARPQRRAPKPAPNLRPFGKKKEERLRNLLVVGFMRSCGAAHLPTKFFDFFNEYYTVFDRWNWDFLRANFTTKTNDLVSIKRTKLQRNQWRNMYGLKHIRMNANTSSVSADKRRTFQWKICVLDRVQIGMERAQKEKDAENELGRSGGGDDEKVAKKEDFELQYMEVLVGVVNVDKMPNSELQRAFNQYSCGHALFGGNGKVYRNNSEWVKVFRPLQHGDTVNINLRWMTKDQFYADYGSKEELAQYLQQKKHEESCVALTFAKNEESNLPYPNNAAFLLEASVSYKLAVASAKMRFEIEWISSNWIGEDEMGGGQKTAETNDDNKQPE